MAIWDFRPKGDLWTGVALGAGLLAAPVVVPLVWCATRPLLKAVLKGGFMFYETGRQALAEVAEGIGKPQGTPATHEKESRATQIVRSRKKSDRELIEKVGIAEEQAIGVQAKPRQREKKQRKKAEKQV